MSVKEKESYEFGEFRLDVAEHFLVRSDSGERVQLSEKAFETLCVLVRNAGHLVNKNDLLNQVWADSFVEENNLNKCVHALRRALGEKPGERQFIETIKKHGFRFVAEVRRVSSEETADGVRRENGFQSKTNGNSSAELTRLPEQAETQKFVAVVALADWRREANGNGAAEQISPAAAPEESTEQTTRLELVPATPNSESKHLSEYRLPLAAFGLAAFLIVAIGLGYYFFSAGKTAVGDKKSIAVLPLKPINTANRDEIYEIGIADSLILRLNSTKGFVVRPLSATRKYADIEQDSLAAGREQQTDYVLASNYQLAGGKIKVTSQLFNVANGQIEETYTIEKDAVNLFAMQDAIAGEVGNKLSARFAAASSSPKAKRGTTNEDAYRLYLQGMYLNGNRNPLDSRKAVKVLEQAVGLDPNYAAAWAGLGHAHRMIANFGRSVNIHEEHQKAIEAINRALALDADLADAHSALCENKMYYEWDFEGAERTCQRAIELDPNSSLAHEIYSRYLSSRGRHDEAITEVKTAIDLEPASLFNQLLYANNLHFARRYTEAVAQYKRVAAMDENSVLTYPLGSMSLALSGNEREAFEWWRKFQTLSKADEETVQSYRAAFQTSGWQGVMRERVKRFDESNLVYFHGAAFDAEVGNEDKAFEYLEKAYQRREYWMSYLEVDPRLDSLRDDPRFDEMVRRVGLK
jgi:DNA-binding winged helix-turn-helix (wHTH) protein/TolB-like protein